MSSVNYDDLALVGGDITPALRTLSGPDAVLQRLQGRLQIVRGEWFLDLDFGVPWLRYMQMKPPPRELIRTSVLDVANGTPGCRATGCTVEVDQSRDVQIQLEVEVADIRYLLEYRVNPAARGNTSPYIFSRVLPRSR